MRQGDNRLTKSIEDYIEAILILEQKGENVQSVKIAHFLNVSKPAVSKAMNELLQLGLIEKVSYGDIHLTERGKHEANKVYEKHITIKKFLLLLGIDEENAEHDCCLIEHVISEKTFDKIKEFVSKNA